MDEGAQLINLLEKVRNLLKLFLGDIFYDWKEYFRKTIQFCIYILINHNPSEDT